MRPLSRCTALIVAVAPLLPMGVSAGHAHVGGSAEISARAAGLPDHRLRAPAAPLTFQRNEGQAAPAVRYIGQAQGVTTLFTRTGVTLVLSRPAARPGDGASTYTQDMVTLAFLHPNSRARITGADRQPGKVSYFLGNHESRWRTGIPTYARVVYHDLWPGVDAGFTARGGDLRYWFTLSPRASASEIHLAYVGARHLSIGPSGELAIATSAGVLRDQAPVSTETTDAHRAPVRSAYQLLGGGRFGFRVAGRSRGAALTIDPGLEYGTYLGGSVADSSYFIAADRDGYLYVFGQTASPDFPTTPGAYQRTFTAKVGGVFFVTKFNPTGTRLVYSTFVGGTGFQGLADGVPDKAGDVYVTGETGSTDFPTTRGSYRTSPYLSRTQSVVFKLNPTGSKLLYSTYLAPDLVSASNSREIALAGDGSVIVTGVTDVDYAPTTPGAFETSYPGGLLSGYVARVNPTGSRLIYGTYLGAPVASQLRRDPATLDAAAISCDPVSLAADARGAAYIDAGCPGGFPTTPGAYLPTASPVGNGLLVKLAPDGRRLDYATYWAAAPLDSTGAFHDPIGVSGLAVDGNGDAYLAGNVPANSVPVTANAYQANCQPYNPGVTFPDCIGIAEFNPTGTGLLYGSYFGGITDSSPNVTDIALDSSGRMYLVGDAQAGQIPTTSDAYQPSPGEFSVPFYLAVVGKGSLLYSTFFGGANLRCIAQFCGTAGTIEISPHPRSGTVYLGGTAETGMPVSPGAFQQTYPGGVNSAWAAKLGLPSLPSGG